jgi:pyrroloquinoline quinone biosynthesis protein B
LQNDLRLSLLDSYCGIEWQDIDKSADDHIELGELSAKVIQLRSELPRYAKTGSTIGQSIALEMVDPDSKQHLLIAPDVATITAELQEALVTAHAIIFDGTFWSDDELQKVDPKSRTATQMSHLPIIGGSLTSIGQARAQHRIYTHINNTNPILRPGTPPRIAVESAGIAVGEDGMEFEL